MHICIPIDEERGLDSSVCAHFGGALRFLLVNTQDRSFRVLHNGNGGHEHGRCSPIAALAGHSINAMIVGGIGRGAIAHLEAAGISVYLAEHSRAADNIDALARGQLQLVSSHGTCGGHGQGDQSHVGGQGCCGHG